MASTRESSILFVVLLFLNLGWWVGARATMLHVQNQCGLTVCAKYWVPNEIGGGCQELGPGQTWDVGASPRWAGAALWANNGGCAGQPCNTGPPSGVTEFDITVGGGGGQDYYEISIEAGYNIGMRVAPTNGGCCLVDCPIQSNCQGTVPGGSAQIKTCAYGSTDYYVYLCQ